MKGLFRGRYPVYYEGKRIALWDPLEESLCVILTSYIPPGKKCSDFLPSFDGDKITIKLRVK